MNIKLKSWEVGETTNYHPTSLDSEWLTSMSMDPHGLDMIVHWPMKVQKKNVGLICWSGSLSKSLVEQSK